MKTIALFGGSFDPPHIAHEAIINALVALEFIEKVVVMPTFLNPFKESSFAPAHLRLQWLRELFLDEAKVEVNSFEVEKNEKVPTIETINHLQKSYENIYLVIGADNLESLHKWHKFEELKSKVTFIVASRESIDIPKDYLRLEIDEDISSTQLRADLDLSKLPQKIKEKIVTYYKENNEQ